MGFDEGFVHARALEGGVRGQFEFFFGEVLARCGGEGAAACTGGDGGVDRRADGFAGVGQNAEVGKGGGVAGQLPFPARAVGGGDGEAAVVGRRPVVRVGGENTAARRAVLIIGGNKDGTVVAPMQTQGGNGGNSVRQLAGQLEGGIADKVFDTGDGGLCGLRRGGGLFGVVVVFQAAAVGVPAYALARTGRGQREVHAADNGDFEGAADLFADLLVLNDQLVQRVVEIGGVEAAVVGEDGRLQIGLVADNDEPAPLAQRRGQVDVAAVGFQRGGVVAAFGQNVFVADGVVGDDGDVFGFEDAEVERVTGSLAVAGEDAGFAVFAADGHGCFLV